MRTCGRASRPTAKRKRRKRPEPPRGVRRLDGHRFGTAADEIIDIIIAAGFKLGCRPGPDDPPVPEPSHAMRDGPRARHVMGDVDGSAPESAYTADAHGRESCSESGWPYVTIRGGA